MPSADLRGERSLDRQNNSPVQETPSPGHLPLAPPMDGEKYEGDIGAPMAAKGVVETMSPVQVLPESVNAPLISSVLNRAKVNGSSIYETEEPLSHEDQHHLTIVHAAPSEVEQARSMIRAQLESAKFYPASARRRGIGGDVEVGFRLNDAGFAEELLVLTGSGYAVLDQAALATVTRAQPFYPCAGAYQFRLQFRQL